jgi:integrase/recombinase XerD
MMCMDVFLSVRDELVDGFVVFMKTELNLARNTVEGYVSDINDFFNFLGEKCQKDNGDMVECVRLYMSHLNNMGFKRSSFMRRVSALNRFFNFLVSQRKIEHNPMVKIKRPRVAVVVPKFLTEDEVEGMLQSVKMDDSKRGLRDALIIELVFASGMRVSELVSLTRSGVLECVGQKSDSGEHFMLRIMGKGNKERTVPLRDRTVEMLRVFLAGMGAGVNRCREKFLFASRSSVGHITREQVGLIIKKRAMECGIDPSRVSPHVLRHSFATNLCKKNVNLRLIQQMLGHSSISTTEIYLHNATNEVVDFVANHHPLAKCK